MVKLFSTHCPKCNVLTKKLNANNIEYEEITNIDEMKKLDITQVPMLLVEDKLMNFSEANNWINTQNK